MTPPGNIPLGEWSGSAATEALHETIQEFNDQASAQAQAMIRLTWAIVVLTACMLIGLVVQIVLAA